MKTLALTLLLIAIAAALPAMAAGPVAIGHIASIHGKPHISHLHEEIPEEAATGDAVYEGDVVKTNEGQSVEILFNDKTNITIAGKDGELSIDQYVYDPAHPQNNKAHYSILRASFEFIGGLLDKGRPDDVALSLDFGSVGIRGTKILRSMKNGECWIYLEEGAITVSNDGGSVDLIPGQGTRMSSNRNKPPTTPEKWAESDTDWIKAAVHPE